MANTYQYCVAENWGRGFIDHDESFRITFKGYPGNVWQVPAYNKHANLWIAKVAGTIKTKDEAQAIVDAEVQAAQTEEWNGASWVEVADMSASGGFGVAGVAADSTSALAFGGAPPVSVATEEWSSTSNTTKVLTD